MIDALLAWSLRRRALVLAIATLVVIVGIRTATRMPVDVFPDLTAPSVTVLTEAHGMAPEEVERSVLFPIETALGGATGVRRVRSLAGVGIGVVWVEFEWGEDVFRARQIVAEKLALVGPSLPAEIDPPVLAPVSSIMGEILFLGMVGEGMDLRAQRALADWDLRRRLLAIPGVAQVVPMGGAVQQYQVIARPERMARHDVALDELVAAVRAGHADAAAGFVRHGDQEAVIYGIGRAGSAADIAAAVVRRRDGRTVRVVDVADVQIGDALTRGEAAINGAPGVVIGVQKQPGTNTLALTGRIDEMLAEVQRTLPPGVRIERGLLRQADFIATAVDNVAHALRDGALLVILVVSLFLVSARATLITALAIPLSLLVATMVLHALGATFDTMTLGGMAIAVGALVDDAIIDVENVVRRLRERRTLATPPPVLDVVLAASVEIRSSIVFATLIIALVFAPMLLLHGVEGRLLRPLGQAYIIALLASLLVAVTVTPALCSWLLPGSGVVQRDHAPRLGAWLCRHYEALLRRVVPYGRAWLVGSLVLVVLAGVALLVTGRGFLPPFREGALTVSVVTLPGTSLAASSALGARVERILLDAPEVVSTARRTGRAELDEHAQGIHASEIDVRLQLRERPMAALLAALRADFSAIQGANIVIGQPISHRIDHMLSGTRANIAIKCLGHDLPALQRTATAVKAAIEGVPNLVDVSLEEQTSMPVAMVRLRRDALARHGLRVHDVGEAMEVAFRGLTVGTIREGARAFDIVVRGPERGRDDLAALGELRVRGPEGAWVRLRDLAEIRADRRPLQITRENGERKVVVMANVAGGDLVGAVDRIRARVDAAVTVPDGVRIVYGGQFEAADAATRDLLLFGLLVVVGVLLLLQLALGTWRDALLVMINLPLALIGGVAGVLVSGGVLSIASIIGLITLFGIATRNGIMLVAHIRHVADSAPERPTIEAVIQGSSERLVPILMTALASALGLLPIVLAAGEPGSEIQAPMAWVILTGLGSATVLNMLVVPAVMLRYGLQRTPEA